MNKKELKQKLVELCLKEINIKVKFNDNLKEAGLDSLTMVEFIISVENTFKIIFDDSDLEPKNLNTLNDIARMMEKYL